MTRWQRVLVALAFWLLRKAGRDAITVPSAVVPLISAARIATALVDAGAPEGASGEWKRHQAYAQMLKAQEMRGSGVPKRLIGLAIELALQD